MQIEHSLVLGADPRTLWPWLATPEGLSRWIGEARSVESRPAGELEVGSLLIVHPPRGQPVEARVERADPGRTLVLRATGLPNDLEALLTFVVEAHPEGSRLTVRGETQLTGLMVFAEGLIASKAQAKLTAWLEVLQNAARSQR